MRRLGCGCAALKTGIYFFQSCQLLRNGVLMWWPSIWCTFWESGLRGKLLLRCSHERRIVSKAIFSGQFKAAKLYHCFKCLLYYFSNLSNRKNGFPIDSFEFLFQRQKQIYFQNQLCYYLRLCCFSVKEALERRALLGDFQAHLQRQTVSWRAYILNGQDGQRVKERKWYEPWFAEEAHWD